jgi:tetratricopeptide (TPR) repeat protein
MDRDEPSNQNNVPAQDIQINTPVQGLNIAREQHITQIFNPSAPAPDKSLAPLWTVPLLRNSHFTGRSDLLAQLAERLIPPSNEDGQPTPKRTALTQPQAITGLGGIGKTQLAVEYAYRSRGRYTHTLWINAASEEAIISSFVALAAEVLPASIVESETDQHNLAALVRRWLERCEQSWLLICDNADDPLIVVPYLPRSGKGSILLTTRDQAPGSFAAPLAVDKMELQEGIALLLTRAQRTDKIAEAEREAVHQIVQALDGLPLALDQAGAYIEENRCSFADYLQLYQKQHVKLLAQRGKQAGNYLESVATTWMISIAKVEQASAAATDLLRLCAFLDPNQIPEELISEGAAHWPPSLQAAAADPLAFNHMLAKLLKYSLISRQPESRSLRIHRLVQVVQLDAMDLETQRQWAERVVLAVNALFPHNPNDVNMWPHCQRYLAQVQKCDVLIKDYALLRSEAADLLNRAGIYLYHHNLYAQAEPLYQRACSILEQLSSIVHPHTASILNNLAILYKAQSKYEQAEVHYQRALSIREQQVGPLHPHTASILNNLAILYAQQSQYEQAELLFKRALTIRKQQLGPCHHLTADSFHNLAALFAVEGKHKRAEPFLKYALSIYEQQLGSLHLDTARSLNNLAGLYYQQGQYEEAEPVYLRALAIYEQQLGPDHPDTARSLNNLGLLYKERGRYKQAEPLLKRALAIYERVLGSDHPRTQGTRRNYATLLRAMGRDAEAP